MMKNQKKKYLQGEINQLGTYCRTRIIETFYRGINKLMKGYKLEII